VSRRTENNAGPSHAHQAAVRRQAGTNLVLITHSPTLGRLGRMRSKSRERASILRPDGKGGYTLVDRLHRGNGRDWRRRLT